MMATTNNNYEGDLTNNPSLATPDSGVKRYWDEVLYKPRAATIRGSYYGVITQDELDDELFNIAKRAINTFKFPRVKLDYKVFYAVRDENDDNVLNEVPADTEDAIPHGYFINQVTDKEIEVILAWRKVYWIERFLSNSDDFENSYTDSTIKTFSRANLVQQNLSRYNQFLAQAHEIETRYSRVSATGAASLGDINNDNED